MAEIDPHLYRIYRSIRYMAGEEIAVANLIGLYDCMPSSHETPLYSKLRDAVGLCLPKRDERLIREGKC